MRARKDFMGVFARRCKSGRFVAIAAAVAAIGSGTAARANETPLVPSAQTYDAGVFRYSQGWERVAARTDGRYHGASLRGFRAGARATLAFVGTSFRLYGVLGDHGGNGLVTVDGRPTFVMNFYAAQKATHRVVYASTTMPRGTHRVTVEILHGDMPDKRYVNLDGIDVR
ncbi:MAG: hypothetical protein NVS2B8_06030 [Vulcanimicrobiaceae bacterium]